MEARIGDKIRIIHMDGEPNYTDKTGIIEKIDDRSKNIEIVQYNLKDQITDEFANVLQKQDAVIALLDTLNKEPSLYNKARKGILSGVAVTADIVTLITAANPDLPASICENAAIVLEKLIQMIG